MADTPPLAVTMGDPSGIGPDIILRAWQDRHALSLPPFFVAGSPDFFDRRSKQLGFDTPITAYSAGQKADPDRLGVLDTGVTVNGEAGVPDASDAMATIKAISTSVDFCFTGEASAVVTCPINKKVLYDAGFNHPGHTEYLAELGREKTGQAHLPVMMLAGPELRTVPVTIHIALSRIPEFLTADLIFETASITARDLGQRFGIASPRLAISGLNPHAGEDGSMGTEDQEIILPAVKRLQDAGLDALGPLPADTMFHEAARKRYDVAICMYHDQALIPAKTLAFDDAVNVTLGLPFIRTSPDHGTAYDIAGTGKANPSSFVAALKMAWQMGSRR